MRRSASRPSAGNRSVAGSDVVGDPDTDPRETHESIAGSAEARSLKPDVRRPAPQAPFVLVVDNYDSFTYNLVQLLLVAGARVEVLRNDADTAEGMLARRPDGLLLSPGPGRPEEAGVCLGLIAARPEVPILGVCLGHQALGLAFGARVERSAHLMHGKTSAVRHRGIGLFAGLPNPFEATRYHSLEVPESSLSDQLEPLAWSDDGVLQGMRHRRLPYWGVQFHPESVLTREGPRLVENFLALCGPEPSRREVTSS